MSGSEWTGAHPGGISRRAFAGASREARLVWSRPLAREHAQAASPVRYVIHDDARVRIVIGSTVGTSRSPRHSLNRQTR